MDPKGIATAKRIIKRLPPREKLMARGKAVTLKNGKFLRLDKLGYWSWIQDREGKKWIQHGPHEWQIDRSLTLCSITAAARHIAFATPEEVYAVYKYVDRTNPLMGKFCDGRRDPDSEYARQVQQLLEKEQNGTLKPGGLLGALAVFDYLGRISFTRVNSPAIWYYDNETYMHLLSETKDMPYMIHRPVYLQKLLNRLAQIGLVYIENYSEHHKRGRPTKVYNLTPLGWDALYKLLHLYNTYLYGDHVTKLKYFKGYAIHHLTPLKLVRYTISLQVLDYVIKHNVLNTGIVTVWLHRYNRCYLPYPVVVGNTVYPYTTVVVGKGCNTLWMPENRGRPLREAGPAHTVVGDSGSAKGHGPPM